MNYLTSTKLAEIQLPVSEECFSNEESFKRLELILKKTI
jgi:hypothetical protein